MTTLTVGQGQQFSTLAAAIAASHNGDVIDVQAGTYTNDFATITTNITIEGVGGMVNLVATSAPPNGKAILTTDANITLDHISFSGAVVPDGNGAGIRYETGNLMVNNCYFHDNQDGLLGGADANGTITINNSEFANNGAGDGFTHNLYVGQIAQLTVNNSLFTGAIVGHEIKSRALNTTIENSRIIDGPTGTASYSIDLPNGGNAIIRNDVIEKGPQSENNAIISFAEETSTPYAGSNLQITGVTVLNDDGANAVLIHNSDTAMTPTLTNAQIYGLNAAHLISGGSLSQSGVTFLTSEPALDLSQPFTGSSSGSGGTGSTGGGSTGGGGNPSVSSDGSILLAGASGHLVTSDGSWSFGTATTRQGGTAILLNGQAAASGFAKELIVDANGHLFANSQNGLWWEWLNSGWTQTTDPTVGTGGGTTTGGGTGGSTVSADGSILLVGTNGHLVTGDGTWSFGTATTTQGGTAILLDGHAAANGFAKELIVDGNGHLFANSQNGLWWEWGNSAWTQTTDPTSGGTTSGGTTGNAISADGSSLMPGTSGHLVTSDGTWSFGTAITSQGGTAILLDGQAAAAGFAKDLVVDANGHLFANSQNGMWWEWSGKGWTQVATDLATVTPAVGHAPPAVAVSGNGESFVFSNLNQIGATIENFSAQLDTLNVKALLAAVKIASGDPTANGALSFDSSGTDSTTLHLHTTDAHNYALVTLDHVAPSALPHADLIWS